MVSEADLFSPGSARRDVCITRMGTEVALSYENSKIIAGERRSKKAFLF
jgi:hypothetical protein